MTGDPRHRDRDGAEPQRDAFEGRQDRRRKVLARIILASQVVAVLYLGVHGLITWRAYEADGVLAAILTLVLLGFGDLYWAIRWFYEGAAPDMASLALLAAIVCFVSWATRGLFDRWARDFTVEMLQDFGKELDQIKAEWEAADKAEGSLELDNDASGSEPLRDASQSTVEQREEK
jgi:hypothetical protein